MRNGGKSMHNFLIQESAFSAAPVIQKKNPNTVEFIAVLQEADRPNRNGRIYYKTVLEQALQAPYVQERLRTNSFYCEAGHPADTSVQRQMTIDQRNIACLIKEFWWEGNLLKARVETANTSIGRDMKGLIEQGSRVAFSLRAQGNVHHDPQINATIVESPIQIATYDWVVNPSHDKAFLENICEDTRCSMFGVKESKSLVLAESVKLYESGRIIALNEVTQPVVHDYAKNFWKKVKPLAEAYVHDPKDRLVVAEKVATVQNDNVTKKVVLEDFLLKDIRHRILKLTEEGEAAAQPVATSDAPADEHTPSASKEDVHTSQSAEEVKAPIIESKKLSDEDGKTLVKDATKEQLERLIDATGSTQKKIVNPGATNSRPVKIKEELGEVAAEPVATSDSPAKEHTPEVEQDEVHTSQSAEEVKAPIIESDLGDAASQPVATSDSKPDEHTPSASKEDVHTSQSAEEVKAPIIESRKLPEALKKNMHDDPKDSNKIPEKLEKKHLKEESEEAVPAEPTVEVSTEVQPDLMVSDDSIRIEIPLAGQEVISEVTPEEEEALKEAFRQVRGIVSGKRINEEETVEVPADAEATVSVEGEKLVVEIPVENPIQTIPQEQVDGLSEAVSAIAFILRK
jgi:hypothetical protein